MAGVHFTANHVVVRAVNDVDYISSTGITPAAPQFKNHTAPIQLYDGTCTGVVVNYLPSTSKPARSYTFKGNTSVNLSSDTTVIIQGGASDGATVTVTDCGNNEIAKWNVVHP